MGKKKKKITIEIDDAKEVKQAEEATGAEVPEGTPETEATEESATAAEADASPEETVAGTETETEATEAAENVATTEEAAEEEPSGQGFFSQNKKDEKDGKIAELTDRLQRQMAEFENFRKRNEKEKSTMYDMGAKDILEKLLPVVDNFERGLEGADESDPFVSGMAMIHKQLMSMLTEVGVAPIEAAGKEFDPNLHNAVMHVDDESVGDNVVIEELQKGYTYKDQVIRYSMVKVAN